MIFYLALCLLVADLPNEKLLDRIVKRYSKADGIQWSINTTVFSPLFEETETTSTHFFYNPPDTFLIKNKGEEILGIGDTVWIMSEKHHQIQKRNMNNGQNPMKFVFKWREKYELKNCVKQGKTTTFHLASKDNATPNKVRLETGEKDQIKSIAYTNPSGDEVVLSITREKLKRFEKIPLFHIEIPEGFELIDITN